MQLAILIGLIGIGLSASNFYIGQFTAYGSTTVVYNWAYPVDMCARSSNGPGSIMYMCAADDMSITEIKYSDYACMTQTTNQTWWSSGTAGTAGSWMCNGNNNYAAMELYIADPECAGYVTPGTPYLTQLYAPDLCYATATSPVYAKTTCDEGMFSVDLYYGASTCASVAFYANQVNATDMCEFYTTTAGVTLTGKIVACVTDTVDWMAPEVTSTTTMEPETTASTTMSSTTATTTTTAAPSRGEMITIMGTIALFIMIHAVLLL